MRNRAFLFPGQGAQYVGMGKDLYESFALVRHTFEEAGDLLQRDIAQLILEGPEEELILTKHSQVAIYVVSIAIWRLLQEQFPTLTATVCAGLSLGEYTALTACGKLPFDACLPLVAARAQFMHEACQAAAGTMRVVLGMSAEQVRALGAKNCWIANLNCPGQVVIAGTLEGIQATEQQLSSKGAKRILPLEVSGAFHSGLMRSAKEKLGPLIERAPLQESPIDLMMNVAGRCVKDLREIKTFLTEQVTETVLWEQGIRAMMASGVESYIEIGPGKTLSGMNKRIGVAGVTLSVESVADLDKIGELVCC